ncbi:MAG: arsenate reductase family protein [Chloroflexota bacterium]
MTCRKGREFLVQKNPNVQERDYFFQRFTRDELVELLGARGPSELFSFKSPTAKAQGITPGSRTDDELLDLMVQEPRLIRRPILKRGDTLLIGFNVKEWEAALSS